MIQVNIDNAPPQAFMAQPNPGDLFSAEKDEWVDLDARVSDDQSIGRVEFYANGAKFAERNSAPFNVKFTIGGNRGSFDFYVMAYDGAGNKIQSEPVRVAIGN